MCDEWSSIMIHENVWKVGQRKMLVVCLCDVVELKINQKLFYASLKSFVQNLDYLMHVLQILKKTIVCNLNII